MMTMLNSVEQRSLVRSPYDMKLELKPQTWFDLLFFDMIG